MNSKEKINILEEKIKNIEEKIKMPENSCSQLQKEEMDALSQDRMYLKILKEKIKMLKLKKN